MDGYEIGVAIAELRARLGELESRVSDDRWAESAAVTELAENIAQLRVALNALTPDEPEETPAEETPIEVIIEGDEPDETETAVEEETAEILDDVSDAIDEVVPTREHPLHRRIF
jgi:hypothetical protein